MQRLARNNLNNLGLFSAPDSNTRIAAGQGVVIHPGAAEPLAGDRPSAVIPLDGKPVIWADHDVRGGPLNSQTVAVDPHGKRTVFCRVDVGTLGPISHADAVRTTDRTSGEYSSNATADIEFVNAGVCSHTSSRTRSS